jgi:drug/metabolite transporter (DMT)-like permease
VELWVWITLFAVVMQVGRHSLQKHLTASMKAMAVVWVRFLFGLPFGLLYFDAEIPAVTPYAWACSFAAAITQIMGTFFIIKLFGERNFAVGVTFTKTEVIQAVFLGFVLVGDQTTTIGYLAIVLSMVGVMVLSMRGGVFGFGNLVTGLFTRAAMLGIASGLGFASASVFIRAAALDLEDVGFLLRAGVILVVVISIEAVLIGIYFVWCDRNEIFNIFRQWKPSLLVGLTSALGSVGWFNAMTLERVAYVKTVSQLEVILSILVSYVVFKERSKLYELVGMALVVSAIVVLLLFA